MRLGGLASGLGRLLAGENSIAQKIYEHPVKNFAAIRIAYVIADQHVLVEKQPVIPPALYEDQAVFQHFVGIRAFVAEKRFARLGERRFLEIRENLVKLLSNLAEHFAAPALNFREARFQDVCLFASFEKRSAIANALFRLEQ